MLKKTIVMSNENTIEYILMNPTDNYTVLVLSYVPTDQYERIAKMLLKKEPKAEQVGFLTLKSDKEINLRMAGGEFCGNATMSAAVYYCMKNVINSEKVAINVYGIDGLINVQVDKKNDDEWEGIVEMPKANEIKEITFPDGETFPVVFMDGIAHIIAIIDSDEYDKMFEQNLKQNVFKDRCVFLDVPALGIMKYYTKNKKLIPYVYVKNVDTMYCENSCASGTAALGYYLDSKSDDPINVSVTQNCGKKLEVYTTIENKLYLKGNVKIENSRKICI